MTTLALDSYHLECEPDVETEEKYPIEKKAHERDKVSQPVICNI